MLSISPGASRLIESPHHLQQAGMPAAAGETVATDAPPKAMANTARRAATRRRAEVRIMVGSLVKML